MGVAIPIRDCAIAVGKRREKLRELVEAGKVRAIRDGGTDHAPRLRVDPDEVRAALAEESLYIPKAIRKNASSAASFSAACRRRRASHSGTLHPAAEGMRKRGATHA